MQIAVPCPENRTNVRISTFALQAGFRTVGATSPALAAHLAERLWARPPRARQRREQLAILATADRHRVETDEASVAVYAWGESGPAAILAHGWGGHAGQLAPLVEPLRSAGFRVFAFDAPGHGATGGRTSHIPAFARAIAAVDCLAGGASAVIAHSFGAAATAFALQTQAFHPDGAVFLAPAADFEAASRRFAALLGISESIRARMQRRFERRIGIEWDRLNVPATSRAMRTPLLVVHDEGDRVVPPQEGAAIAAAWPGARLERTAGLGHHRILRDPAIAARVVDFLGRPAHREGRAWMAA